MKYLQTYNESLYGELSRLNPKRYENDVKGSKLMQEIFDDFEKHGRDLNKVKIVDDDGKIINDGKIEIGKKAMLWYIFGKYHPVKNSHDSGNQQSGNRRVQFNYIPFSLTLKKNSLEKMFKTRRISMAETIVKDTKTVDNPEYNPNIIRNMGVQDVLYGDSPSESDRRKMVRYHTIDDRYKISPDVAGELLKFFLKEYKIQYPTISGRYKNSLEILDVKRGVPPILKYISVRGRDGEELTYGLRKGEDEKEIKKLLRGMTKKEYDIYWKKRNKELYKDVEIKEEKNRKESVEKWGTFFDSLLNKYQIIPLIKDPKWTRNGLSIKVYGNYEVKIEFSTKSYTEEKLNEKLKLLSKENFGDYKLTKYHVGPGYSDKTEMYVTIILENE